MITKFTYNRKQRIMSYIVIISTILAPAFVFSMLLTVVKLADSNARDMNDRLQAERHQSTFIVHSISTTDICDITLCFSSNGANTHRQVTCINSLYCFDEHTLPSTLKLDQTCTVVTNTSSLDSLVQHSSNIFNKPPIVITRDYVVSMECV